MHVHFLPEIVPVPGYEKFYGASRDGRVYSLNYRRTGRVVELAQAFLYDKRRTSATMYKRAKMWHITKYSPTAIHRVIALTFVPNPDNLLQVNHKDGDKGNNHADNLEWCTVAQNLRHAEVNNLAVHPRGEEHVNHILTEKEVMEIKNELQNTPKYNGQLTALGARYGVSLYCIFDIKRGKSWKHL